MVRPDDGRPDVKGVKLPKIDRSTGSQRAMEVLLDSIRKGMLRPGDRIPPERELVSQLGLSRTGVREALRGLASSGVIEISPGRGTFVRKISPELLVDPDALFFLLQRETLLHAIEVRRILEAEAVALAAQRADADDLAEIERVLRRMKSAVKSDLNPHGQSAPFHLAIAKATHNPVLCNIVRPFIRLISQAAPTIAERLPAARETEYLEHAEVYESILKRDPEEARRRMQKHLDIAESTILEAFKEPVAAPVNPPGDH